MDFIRFEFLIEVIRNESRRNLSSVNIMKTIDTKAYKDFRFAAVSTFISLFIFLFMILLSIKVNFAATLLLGYFIFLYFKVVKFNKVIKNSEKKMQDYRLLYLENKVVELKVNNVELSELIRCFDENGVKNQKSSLKMSAAFAILLLPIWEIIVNNIFEINELTTVNLNRIMTLLIILGIIIVILTLYLYLEKKLLYFYNYYPKVDINIARMLRIIQLKRSNYEE